MHRRDFVSGLAGAGGLSAVGGVPALADGSGGRRGENVTGYWTTGEKYGVETVPDHDDPESLVWATVTAGALTEARFPRADLMNLRSVDFLVAAADGSSYAARTLNVAREDDDRSAIERRAEIVESDALVFRHTVRDPSGSGTGRDWTLTAEWVVDPAGDAVVADVSFAADDGGEYDVYAVVDPALSNSALSDAANREGDGPYRFTAYDDRDDDADAAFLDADGEPYDNALAVVSEGGFDWATADRAAGTGNRERWTDGVAADRDVADLLTDGDASVSTGETAEGNVVLVGRLANETGAAEETLALGFAEDRDTDAATAAAEDALDRGYAAVREAYVAAWESYLDERVGDLPSSVDPDGDGSAALADQYRACAMTLKAVEDKTFAGASLASPSVPWGEAAVADEPRDFGYNFTWARDLYQVFTALEAMGDAESAALSAEYVYEYQQGDDGFVPQNTYLDGRTRWGGEQMDNVAFPAVMAYQLAERHGYDLDAADYGYESVRATGDYVVANGPHSEQERWEEESGYSPSTIAAEIAGLVCAAELADDAGERADALLFAGVADRWQARVEDWLATDGDGTHEPTPYYVRVSENRDPNDEATRSLANGGATFDERNVIDAGFLELVRLGVKPADDEVVRNSVDVVDDAIRVETPHGPAWYRYTGDGYGEQPENDEEGAPWGAPWSDDVPELDTGGKGRLWPIFTGERGEYELLAGEEDPRALLEAMAGFANSGRMIPEQVWDRPEPSPYGWEFGEGTGSATPLAWSMAGFVRLAHGVDAGEPVETPAAVRERYVDGSPPDGPALDVTVPETVEETSVTVEGSTDGAEVVVRTPAETVAVEPDGDGAFAADASLVDGDNEVTVVAATDGDDLAAVGTTTVEATVGVESEPVASWADETGDDDGPGGYTYPTADAFADGCFDLTGFAVGASPESYRFTWEVAELGDPWGGENGFSPQWFEVCVRDPDASAGATALQEGANASTAAPYQYRFGVHGWDAYALDHEGEPLADDLVVSTDSEAGAVTLTVPESAVGGDLGSMEFAVAVMSEDQGGVRPVQAGNGEYVFGGGRDDDANPNVIDVLTPEGVDQSAALAYEGDDPVVPFVAVDGESDANEDVRDRTAASDDEGDEASAGGQPGFGALGGAAAALGGSLYAAKRRLDGSSEEE